MSTEADVFGGDDIIIMIPDDESLITETFETGVLEISSTDEPLNAPGNAPYLLGFFVSLLVFLVLVNILVWNQCYSYIDGKDGTPPQPSTFFPLVRNVNRVCSPCNS